MNVMKTFGWLCLVLGAFFLMDSSVWAQDKAAPFYGGAMGAGIGAGLTILGAAYGFGKIGSSALESMARQPETAGQVQTAMIIIGALLEGATFFSLVVCFMIQGKA